MTRSVPGLTLAPAALTRSRRESFKLGAGMGFLDNLESNLKTLESQGVIATRLYENHPPRYEYYLTDKGKALGPVLKALYNWGERHG